MRKLAVLVGQQRPHRWVNFTFQFGQNTFGLQQVSYSCIQDTEANDDEPAVQYRIGVDECLNNLKPTICRSGRVSSGASHRLPRYSVQSSSVLSRVFE